MRYSVEQRSILREADAIKRDERKASKQARPKSPKADRGRVRDPGFLAFLRRQSCAVGPDGCSGPVEAAHVRYSVPGEGSTGMQRKPSDTRAVPLCRVHHRDGPDAQHSTSERAWWAKHGIDPLALAARLFVIYLRDEA